MNSVAIVTGASQGIARSTSIRLAREALKKSNGSVVFISGSAALDPKPAFAALAAINAAITALAKAFAEQGIKDGVQVNSVVPGPVVTGRRRSFMEKWAPAHEMSEEDEAISRKSGDQSLRKAGRDRRPARIHGVAGGEMDDGYICAHGRRRDQRH